MAPRCARWTWRWPPGCSRTRQPRAPRRAPPPRPALPWSLALGLHNPGAAAGELRVYLEGDGVQRSFLVLRQPGRQMVYLHGGEIGFPPHRVRLEGAGAGAAATGLYAAAVEPLPPGGPAEPPAAIPADLGTILRLDRSHWRRGDFELYEWAGRAGGRGAAADFRHR